MKTKRKVGKKCNVYCEYQNKGICHTYGNVWRLCEKRKPKQEVKNCENCGCTTKETGCLSPEFLSGKHCQGKFWKPKQEEIVIEITRGPYTGNTFGSNILSVYDRYNEELKKLIPKGSTQKFKLVKVEGR